MTSANRGGATSAAPGEADDPRPPGPDGDTPRGPPSSDVSRETAARAAEVFGPAAAAAGRYAHLLITTGVTRGLIGPREVDRIWERHIFNCAAVAGALPRSADVVDIGSGAGLPGIVLALARPDVSLLLVEPLQRRVDFLIEAVAALGLSSVAVRRARAEDLHGEVRADVVTARAVAPMERLVTIAMPLLRPGGILLALKGRRAAEELASAEKSLRALGAARWSVERWDGRMLAEATTVVRVVAGTRRNRSADAAPGAVEPRHAANADRRRPIAREEGTG